MRDLVVAEARKYLGTPYHHQGRILGHGVDCYGLIEMVARGLGFACPEKVRYSRLPDATQLIAYMDEYAIPVTTPQPGDILIMTFMDQMRHMGIMTDVGMIHSYEPSRMVIEHAIDSVWQRRIKRAYAFKEVING